LRRIHVVAGVLEDPAGRVLIAQRPAGKPMAGAWEFPGGKLDENEARFPGLVRELNEELGLAVRAGRPLIRYLHHYPDVEVDLDVWRVERWHGTPAGVEGQALEWVAPGALLDTGLLPADEAVARAIRLPAVVAVTPAAASQDNPALMDALEDIASTGRAGFIVLRRPDLAPESLLEMAAGAACRVEETPGRLILHGDPAVLAPLVADLPPHLAQRLAGRVAGLHIPGRCLGELSGRPVPERLWFGASCHSREELEAALRLGADYAFLGSVKPTSSHPGSPGLGWERFAEIIEGLALPVYAIGGMGPDDLEEAWSAGAQGIAAIRSLWAGVA
jgi:8-oxo-dGTP diphosphatase